MQSHHQLVGDDQDRVQNFHVGFLQHVVGDPLCVVGDPLRVVGDPLCVVGDPLRVVGDPLCVVGTH